MTHLDDLVEKFEPLVEEKVNAGLLVGNDPYLRTPCEKLEEVDDEALDKMTYMEDILLEVGGKALTANQIGWTKQVVVADYDDTIHYVINPDINIRYGSHKPVTEHCLSLPGIKVEVPRYKAVHVRGYELSKVEGEYLTVSMDATFMGVNSQMWQHEMEHINGKLFTDSIKDSSVKEEVALELSIIDSLNQELS